MKKFYFDGLVMENIYSFLPKTFTFGQKIIYKNYSIIIQKRTDKFICLIMYETEEIAPYENIPGFDIAKTSFLFFKIRRKIYINNEGIEYFKHHKTDNIIKAQ